MTMERDTEMPNADTAAPEAPLFYERAEPLQALRHGALRLKTGMDFAFARQTNSTPIAAGEFTQIMRFYPIVFSGKGGLPVAVLGFGETNLFVDADDGWRKGLYIPAYMRRYPFIFIAHPDGTQFLLGVDRSCKRLVESKEEGSPLFENGEPSALTHDAMRFCGAFQSDHRSTAVFAQALEEQKLLVDHQLRARTQDGRQFDLQGFKIVDRAAFAKLPDATVVEWHKLGYLPLIHFHLASLDRFQDVMNLLKDVQPDSDVQSG